jgi:hypothetical protein
MTIQFIGHKFFVKWTEILKLFVDIMSCKGENMSRASHSEKNLQKEGNGGVKFGPDHPSTMDYTEHVESSFNIQGVSIAMPQSSEDPECSKSVYKSDAALPTKAKKLNTDRSDSKKYVDYVHRALLFLILYFCQYKLQFEMNLPYSIIF